jgi:hypothetical protein
LANVCAACGTALDRANRIVIGVQEKRVSAEQDGDVPVLMRPAVMHEAHWPPRGDWRELARGAVADLLDPLPSRSLVGETGEGVPTEWIIRNPALTILQNAGWIERATSAMDGGDRRHVANAATWLAERGFSMRAIGVSPSRIEIEANVEGIE